MKDDRLATIFHGNKNNSVLIKTPAGEIKRVDIKSIVTQGGAVAPSACSVQTDTIGK